MEKLSNTLYAKYIKEREDLDIIENEVGFITYKTRALECFIADMFVDLEERGKRKGIKLLEELVVKAKDAGCTHITATVHLWDNGASNTLFAALKSGFKVAQAQNGSLLIVKDIGG